MKDEMAEILSTPHGDLTLPVFLPDATRAVVRSVDAADLVGSGVQGVVVNTFHLLSKPGIRTLSSGGIHRFMGWDRPVVSDSGGFQIYSLLTKNPKLGSVTSDGFTYRMSKGAKKINLGPAKSIQRQFRLGADIMICLDHCMHPDEPDERHRESVENTVKWSRECRVEFDRLLVEKKIDPESKPLLFAVIQGGEDRELRRECTDRLMEIGFDGYGYGGWPLDDNNRLVEAVEAVAEMVPDEFPLFGLGIASPEHIVSCVGMGYSIFDGAFPTRDARRGRLYVHKGGKVEKGKFFTRIYMQDDKHTDDHRPVDESCDCLCCSKYTKAYLYHLFNIEDPLAYRLATIHNLRSYMRMMSELGSGGQSEVHENPAIAEIKRSKKYSSLNIDTIGRVVNWASERAESETDVVKVAKKKLRQVYGAFIDSFDYNKVKALQDQIIPTTRPVALKQTCEQILQCHQSTSERIGILDKACKSIFSVTGKPGSVLDLGCGLHPYSIPWMGLKQGTEYIAWEIDERIVDLVNGYFERSGINGRVELKDVLVDVPDYEVDVVFLLKMVPSLEQQEAGSSRKLIESLKAKWVVVSYPTASIGGAEKGMRENYEDMMEGVIEGMDVGIEKVEFDEEIFWLLRK